MKSSPWNQKKITPRDVQSFLGFALAGLVLVAGLITLNWWLADHYGAGGDLLPAWNGARAFVLDNSDPYGQTAMEQTQRDVYGRIAREGEYPYALDVPFPIQELFLLPVFVVKLVNLAVPSVTVPDVNWVRAVWMTLSEIGLILLVVLALRLADWRPKSWLLLLLAAFTLTWFYSIIALVDASFSILLTLALVGALLAMRDFNDELAGFLLAISALKWEVTFLLWLLILLGAFTTRRWRVFIGMGMTWFALGVISFLLYPGWIWPYLRSVLINWRSNDILTPFVFAQQWLPEYGPKLVWIVVPVLLLVLVLEWFRALRGEDYRRVAWAAALALALTPLVGFSTTFANMAPLAFSFIFALAFVWERWVKHSNFVVSFILLVFYALPIVLRLPLVAARVPANGLLYLLPPVLTILVLYWVRWYVVRPPRTWLDGARREIGK